MTQTIPLSSTAVQLNARRWRQKIKAIAQDILTLAGLMLLLPVNVSIVLCALIADKLLRPKPAKQTTTQSAAARRTVLISGGKMTKALQLARLFHQAGHRVILVETHKYWLSGHRFSRAVDAFFTTPKPTSPQYAAALLEIVQRESVDLYVPVCSPVASTYDSQAIPVLSPHCDVMHVSPDKIEQLDNKYQFAMAAESLGLNVPKSYRITHPQQILDFDFSNESRQYILKSIPYDSVRRLDLTKLPCATPEATANFVNSLPISEKKSWVMQEFIPGQEYCTHSTLRNGELRMHCCCESSAFQVNYKNVDKPEIQSWVRRFAEGLSLTGQASFDFIESYDDGKVYAIECNPRTHSAITMFYYQREVAEAYLGDVPLSMPVQPDANNKPTYWLYHEVWRLLSASFSLHLGWLARKKAIARVLSTLSEGKDAIFDWRDPLPFLMVHHWQIPLLLLQDLRQQKGWIRIDFNIGKLVQLGGD